MRSRFSQSLLLVLFTCTLTAAETINTVELVRFQTPADKPVKPTVVTVDLGVKPISAVSLSIAPPSGGVLPKSVPVVGITPGTRDPAIQRTSWMPWNYYWQAPALAYQPLYFEQPNVERYGHHAGCWQPVLSAAHFFGTVPLLPYKIGSDPCGTCQYTLGHGRPGDCNAWEPHDLRWSTRGALAEAGVVTGMIYLFP